MCRFCERTLTTTLPAAVPWHSGPRASDRHRNVHLTGYCDPSNPALQQAWRSAVVTGERSLRAVVHPELLSVGEVLLVDGWLRPAGYETGWARCPGTRARIGRVAPGRVRRSGPGYQLGEKSGPGPRCQ